MASTVLADIAERARTAPDAPAILQKRYGRWTATSAAALMARATTLAVGLQVEGIQAGDVVGLLLKPHETRVVLDLAVQLAGARVVGVPSNMPADGIAHVLADAGARVVVVQGQSSADVVLELVDQGAVPAITRIYYVDPAGVQDYASRLLAPLEGVVGAGSGTGSTTEELVAALDPDAVAVLNYTSGTTGLPRGVLLTHRNLLAATRATTQAFGLGPDDRVLSFRTLSDPVERGATIYPALASGAVLVLPESRESVRQALYEVAPTYLHLTPRYVKEIATDVRLRMQSAKGLKRLLLRSWHRRFVRRVSEARMPSASAASRLLVGGRVLEKLGLDRARWVLVSGAPVSWETLGFFAALGLRVRPAYSLAEVGGLALCARGDVVAHDTVGTALPGLEARLDDAELEIRGDAVGVAYVDAPHSPLAGADGWMATGDRADADGDGFRVMGRAATVLETSEGRAVAHGAVEAAMRSSPYIREAVVAVENGRTVALLEPTGPSVARWGASQGLRFTTERSLMGLPEVAELLERAVTSAIERFPGLEIDEIRILAEPLTATAGTMTTTEKVVPGAALAAPVLGRTGDPHPTEATRSPESAPVS